MTQPNRSPETEPKWGPINEQLLAAAMKRADRFVVEGAETTDEEATEVAGPETDAPRREYAKIVTAIYNYGIERQ